MRAYVLFYPRVPPGWTAFGFARNCQTSENKMSWNWPD